MISIVLLNITYIAITIFNYMSIFLNIIVSTSILLTFFKKFIEYWNKLLN